MKNIITTYIAICLSALTIAQNADKHIVAHLSQFRGKTYFDESQNENHALPTNGATYKVNSGSYFLYLDGLDDTVEINDDHTLNFIDEFSLALWIKPTRISGYQNILTKMQSVPEGSRQCYSLKLLGDRVYFTVCTTTQTYHLDSYPEQVRVKKNKWNHVVVTFDGNSQSMVIYINGEKIKERTLPQQTTLVTTKNDLAIGRLKNKNYAYQGFMHDIKMYNVALSQENIKDMFTKKKGLLDKDLKN